MFIVVTTCRHLAVVMKEDAHNQAKLRLVVKTMAVRNSANSVDGKETRSKLN